MCNAQTFLFVLTTILCWGAFGLGITAVGSKEWTWTPSNFAGLWVVCTAKDSCTLQVVTASLNAVRAFVIMGIVFGFIGTILYSTSYWNRRAVPVAKAAYGIIYFGALCWTVAMTVYTVTYSPDTVEWGISFIFGWANVGLLNIAGAIAHASISKQEQIREQEGA